MTRQVTYLIAAFTVTVKGHESIRFLRNRSKRGAIRQKRRNEWEDSPDGFGAHQFDDVDGQVEKIQTLLKRLKLTKDLEKRGYTPAIFRVTKVFTGTGIFTNRSKQKIWPVSPLEALALCAQ